MAILFRQQIREKIAVFLMSSDLRDIDSVVLDYLRKKGYRRSEEILRAESRGGDHLPATTKEDQEISMLVPGTFLALPLAAFFAF